MISQQARTRPEVTGTDETLRIVIPAVIKPFEAIALTLWLAGWTLGLIVMPFLPLVPEWPLVDTALRVIVIPLWIYSWGLGCYKLVYGLDGAETIVLSSEQIEVRRQVLDLGPRQIYSIPSSATWRLSPRHHWISDAQYPMHLTFHPGGAITLRSGRRAIRFGRNLNREQAEEILEAIQAISSDSGSSSAVSSVS